MPLSLQKSSFFLLFSAGSLGVLAWSPFNLWPVLAFSLGFLIERLSHSSSLKECTFQAWIWTWGLNVSTLYWVGNSLFVQPWRFGWLWPFCTFGLTGVLALYGALLGILVFYGRRFFWKESWLRYGLGFTVIYSVVEWLKGHLFTGLPWNLTAYIWSAYLPLAQGVAFFGTYAWSLVTILFLTIPGVLFLRKKKKADIFWGIGFQALLFAAGWIWGQHHFWPQETDYQPGVVLRLVQPSIPQEDKHDSQLLQQNWDLLNQLSVRPCTLPHPVTHILWPEGGICWTLSKDSLNELPETLQTTPDPIPVLTGAGYFSPEGDVFNSMVWLKGGQRFFFYHKHHLLPFGEYIPLRRLLDRFLPAWSLQKITAGTRDYSFGTPRPVCQLEGLPPFRMSICYEGIFPLRESKNASEAKWIFNATNDAWFGNSIGPYQHLANIQFRAIEEGIPLVRVANNGISAVFDGYGRCLASLTLNERGTLDILLPKPARKRPYPSANVIFYLWGILFILSIPWPKKHTLGDILAGHS